MIPWWHVEHRTDGQTRTIALVRRGVGDGLWDDPGSAYMMTVEEAVELRESLDAALRKAQTND